MSDLDSKQNGDKETLLWLILSSSFGCDYSILLIKIKITCWPLISMLGCKLCEKKFANIKFLQYFQNNIPLPCKLDKVHL